MLMWANEGYSEIPTAAILGKQPEVQRCKEADDGMVQLLRVGEVELASRTQGGSAQCEHSKEQPGCL